MLVKLLRRHDSLSSEEPADILEFFVRLEQIYNLGLAADRILFVYVLPFVPGSVLMHWGGCVN